MLVHGEEGKMEFLKSKVQAEFGIDCYMPANGETITIQTDCRIPIDVSLNLLKRSFTDNSEFYPSLVSSNLRLVFCRFALPDSFR